MHRGPHDSDVPSCGGLVDGWMDSSSLAPTFVLLLSHNREGITLPRLSYNTDAKVGVGV